VPARRRGREFFYSQYNLRERGKEKRLIPLNTGKSRDKPRKRGKDLKGNQKKIGKGKRTKGRKKQDGTTP